jgi:hypothetical protein
MSKKAWRKRNRGRTCRHKVPPAAAISSTISAGSTASIPAALLFSSCSSPCSNSWECPIGFSATCSWASRSWSMPSSASCSAHHAGVGILCRGPRVPAFYNGMATGADWMSGASFVGMAGTLFLLGYDGLAFVLGWTGGYVLVAILVAPYLRKFGAYTVPDFLAARYERQLRALILGVIVLLACSFTYVVAQIFATGIIAQRFLGMDFVVAVYRRPCRHSRLLHAWRHAGGDLDAGGAIHRADRRLPHSGRHPVGQEVRPADAAAHLRAGDQPDLLARAELRAEGARPGRHEAARRAVHQLLAARTTSR